MSLTIEERVDQLVHGMRVSISAIAGTLYLLEARAESIPAQEQARLVGNALSWVQDLDMEVVRWSFSREANVQTSARPIREALRTFQQVFSEISRRGAETKRGISVKVPDSASEDQRVLFDPLCLRVVFYLLIDNFFRYGARDGAGRLCLSLEHHYEHMLLIVADDGNGIEREIREALFRPGVRGRGATARVPLGAGYGLHDARSMMRAMGGDLAHRPTVKGAAFECRMALAPR
jgi:signal transduction histidine kinase